jgi:hypothetical protein
MITCELMGKLGNMMFQIATIENMGYRSGLLTGYPHVDKNVADLAKPQACSSEYNGQEYFKIFKNFDWHKNHDKVMQVNKTINVPFEYTFIVPQDHTCYIGYFQSELYFPDRDFVLNLFEPNDQIKKRLEDYKGIIGTNKASIHVRRGDYIKLNHIYNVLDMDYYNEAMKILGLCGVREYLVFTNDIDWCISNFRGDQFTFIKEDSFTELFLMGTCTHNIIANSAFSWWGAWLNNNPDRHIIAPKRWFIGGKYKDRDIIPQNWIKI